MTEDLKIENLTDRFVQNATKEELWKVVEYSYKQIMHQVTLRTKYEIEMDEMSADLIRYRSVLRKIAGRGTGWEAEQARAALGKGK